MSNLEVMVMFVVSIELFLGTSLNGFIVLLHCIIWVKTRKISLSDFIILNLALSRIILLGIMMFDTVLSIFYPHLQNVGILMQIIDIFWMFTNNLIICLTTCLSVLYCLKIANFSHQAFLWLKWRVSHVIWGIWGGSGLYSFFSALAMILKFSEYADLSQMKLSGNYSEEVKKKLTNYYVLHILGLLWSVIPLCVSLLSSVLLFLSLVRHTRQMKHHANGTRDLSTMAHVRATKVILSSFILFIGYFLNLFLAMSSHFFPRPKQAVMIWRLFFIAYPSIQTFVLILENRKVKQAFIKMFQVKKWRLKCTPWELSPKT
ncbi:bitter taste receptor Modo-T2R3F [Monodelphis domestica]|uniref:Taste receptor type 2 n=1 Tax=Monodelphis domestica TaxID=13616 RepID=Q2ABA5_MONDO|nr:bitter taste receptor Modo-T2R3F [Monodelphis domestica]BAE80362.1 bitter taste receptor [Monodelphis domestica]